MMSASRLIFFHTGVFLFNLFFFSIKIKLFGFDGKILQAVFALLEREGFNNVSFFLASNYFRVISFIKHLASFDAEHGTSKTCFC